MSEAPPRKRRWLRRLITLAVIAIGVFVYSLQFHPEREDWAGQRAKLAHRQVPAAPARVDAAQVLGPVRTLAAPAMAGRKTGTPGGKAAREYILARMRELQLAPAFGKSYEQPFRFVPFRGIQFWRKSFWGAHPPIDGVNVAGIVRGTVDPGHYLVVSAHYDHLGIRDGKLYPGADDNASGIAAMLAAARWFSAHPPRHSILFVAFDGEERGLKGSEAFVANPPVPLAQMSMDLNFDMVAHNSENEIFATGLYQNPQLRPILEAVRAHAKPTIVFGHDSPEPLWNIMEDWTEQSDQGSFADKHIPFIYMGVADHPDYHQPTDTFEHINQPFFVSVVESVLDLVGALDAADAGTLRKGG
jgi:Zn-dependent M28 family amino/carboxypeptidase